MFHADVVGPLLTRALPRLRYAAGRLGSGSDVLGLDDATSRDHDWGCRLTLLVDEPDREAVPRVSELLERELPESFRGYPIRFGTTWDRSRSHKVHVATVPDFAVSHLGIDPGWRERESAIASAAEVLLDMQRELGLPAPERAVIPFFDRP